MTGNGWQIQDRMYETEFVLPVFVRQYLISRLLATIVKNMIALINMAVTFSYLFFSKLADFIYIIEISFG